MTILQAGNCGDIRGRTGIGKDAPALIFFGSGGRFNRDRMVAGKMSGPIQHRDRLLVLQHMVILIP